MNHAHEKRGHVVKHAGQAVAGRSFAESLVDESPDALIALSPDGTVLFWNHGALAMFGYSAAEAVGRTVEELIVPGDLREELRRQLADVLVRGKVTFETTRQRKDGSSVVVDVSERLVRDEQGRPLFIAVNTKDVTLLRNDATERRRTEMALREAHRELEREAALSRSLNDLRASEARFQRLSTSGVIGIVVADMQGNVHDANEASLRIIGYSHEETCRTNWATLMPPDQRGVAEQTLDDLARGGIAHPRETEVTRKDGTRVPILYGAAMLESPRFIAFVTDISEHKKTALALKNTEEQLRQAQKMEAVGRLAGGVAHDFNNVLSVILSYGELLQADMKPGDPMREDIDEILKAGKRAADLTRQLLMFSRQQVIAPKILDLNEVLVSMDRMLQRLLGADVDLVSLPAEHLGRVRVDPSSMEQVIMNLVVNARDAMPTGGKLTMETGNVVLDDEYARTHHGVAPGPYVMLAVTDTGTGIDPATLARIFEPFFTTKEKDKGTGLGLSTVFGIVQQSAGSIWVYSEPGCGTTFKIYLPRVDAAADAHRTARPPTTLHGSETILLVEDDDQVRAVALGILRRNGYHVIEARNAGEAFLRAESYAGTIHLLLSDVVMPQMSGPQLAKRLASVRPGMRVLCMSGYTDDAIVRHGVLEAHFAFLQKPITPEALAIKVREVLSGEGVVPDDAGGVGALR